MDWMVFVQMIFDFVGWQFFVAFGADYARHIAVRIKVLLFCFGFTF
jgi:hypothetical protein